MRLGLAGVLSVVLAWPALAHELWIEPERYQIAVGDPLMADIRVGQEMEGPAYSFLTRDFRRFDLFQNGELAAVDGRMGDRPALQSILNEAGLVTVVYVTKDLTITYNDFAKFEKFAKHKDFEWALEEHVARGLSKDRLRERYVRYAKSIAAVGEGAGSDVEIGLVTEIVALTNPYTDDLSGGMSVKVLFDGKIRTNAQVELFDKAPDGTVTVTLHRTDDNGIAQLPVTPGHSYLADAVVLRAVPETEDGTVWESLWASLTFAVPAP